MPTEQIWTIIGVIALIALAVGIVRGGYFFAQEQRVREQREYTSLRDSPSSILNRRLENNVQSRESLISWGNIESESAYFNSDVDLEINSRSSSTLRIRWGDDNSVNSDLSPLSAAHWGELEPTSNNHTSEAIGENSGSQVSIEKRICPICKQTIDGSTDDVVSCDGCDTPYHHKCIEDYEGICLICKTELF